MRIAQIFAGFFLGLTLHAAQPFAAPLPGDILPGEYASWPMQTLSCHIKSNVRVELFIYTDRGAKAIHRAVSVWRINGTPFEARYFEPVEDKTSLSGYRASGFAVVLDLEERWIKLGGLGRTMNNNELLLLRMLRYAKLKHYGVSESQFTKGWAACNKDRPGILR